MNKLACILLVLGSAVAQTTLHADEYYSNDIFTAIAEARHRTHHYDYSSALRYDRSTSQSIQIPRLMLKEMEQTSIKTPELAEIEGQGQDKSPDLDSTTISARNNDQKLFPLNSPSINANLGEQQGVSMRAYVN